ncbi:MAG TPA: TraR/DksA C4-type zinc finger protein [Ramlibacter sp.]|uniref:TraR/DksA C4-type zinc finger protein n=1 Tax=Ramlibacter sp. TaxID=1917967 RepID=UPI002BFF1E94|nr:TraR/DksA C4-type zinc finger protein [Ramlibacter sp.]HVZ44804.1 TraR/DksA C4-type zinc finger protein [Ramlibacter sp.]
MTRPTPEFLQARIEGLLDRREAELQAVIAAQTDVAAHEHDRTEVFDGKEAAEEETEALLEDAVAARAAKELEAIAAARQRIAQGTYGTCPSCGEAIDEQRLLAVPAALLCIRCQADPAAARRFS